MSKNKPLPGKVKQDGSRIPFQQNQMTEEFQMQRMKITFWDHRHHWAEWEQ